MSAKRVLILGAGRITSGYDNPGDKAVLTHLHALSLRPFDFAVTVFDTAPGRSAAAAEKWGVRAISAIDDVRPGDFDLVVIATPDENHVSALEQARAWRPQAVLCEKPVALRYADAARIVDAYRAAGIPLSINFQRRFDPIARELQGAFQRGELGELLFGECRYSKGILHNGIHAVDFCRWFFGTPKSFTPLFSRYDHLPSDPSLSAWVSFAKGNVAFLAGDERCFSLFEFDFVFEKARLAFDGGGMWVRRFSVKDDPFFPGYRELTPEPARPTQLSSALTFVYEELANILNGTTVSPSSPGSDSIDSLRLINALCSSPTAIPRELP